MANRDYESKATNPTTEIENFIKRWEDWNNNPNKPLMGLQKTFSVTRIRMQIILPHIIYNIKIQKTGRQPYIKITTEGSLPCRK